MKLKKIEVNAFGGINPNSPIVIDFSESKFVTLSGDTGVGKTSLLNAMLMACGELNPTTKEGENFINLDSNKIDIYFEFVGKDRFTYMVRCTKSSFNLTYEGEAVPKPLTKMKELLGVVGVSPMEIKNAKIQDIVKWLSAYTNKSAEEYETSMRKYKDNSKTAAESRALANKVVKAVDEYLEDEPLAQNWEESEKKYEKAINIQELSKELNTARLKSERYSLAQNKLEEKQKRKKVIEEEIAQLQTELESVEETISLANIYLDENKADQTNYDTIRKKYDTAAQESVNYSKWQEIKRKKSERDQAETLSQKADAQEKDLKKKMADLRAEILPDIKGVELVTEDTHEDGKMKKEGLYWNGVNSIQMSETEWWSLVMSIWRKYKVKIIVIDNMQSLGSGGVELLEKLSKDGAYILAAEMNRQQKELQISYE